MASFAEKLPFNSFGVSEYGIFNPHFEDKIDDLLYSMTKVNPEEETLLISSITDTAPEQFLFDEELDMARLETKIHEENQQKAVDELAQKNLAKLLKLCDQTRPECISTFFSKVYNVSKVGQGIYGTAYEGLGEGEVYPHAFKVIPIGGGEKIDGECQRDLEQARMELMVSIELTKIRDGINNCFTDGFAALFGAHILKGKFPKSLLGGDEGEREARREYESIISSSSGSSINMVPIPNYGESQVYLVLEYNLAGTDILSVVLNNAKDLMSVILQLVHILAVGESATRLEHRDLHAGNILVDVSDTEDRTYVIQGCRYSVPAVGWAVKIIDFALARVDNSTTGNSIFVDFGDDLDQFTCNGSGQYDLYRAMYDVTSGDWELFYPRTNIVWITHMAGRLVNNAVLRDRQSFEHHRFMGKITEFQKDIQKYNSCTEFVRSGESKKFMCDEFSPSLAAIQK